MCRAVAHSVASVGAPPGELDCMCSCMKGTSACRSIGNRKRLQPDFASMARTCCMAPVASWSRPSVVGQR
eukprot:2128587-Alexandrium_andersonii.AAC.1